MSTKTFFWAFILSLGMTGVFSCAAREPRENATATSQSLRGSAMNTSDKTLAAAENAFGSASAANNPPNSASALDTATFGAGCFWCVEAIFQRIDGVESVVSGYSGGAKPNPTYKEVCTGKTGHAEVCQITYNPTKVSFDELLEAFWQTHDPTTPDRQGNDVGTQYRSVVFYHNAEQKRLAEEYKKKLEAAKIWDNPIVTEISPFQAFYKAEAYHQNYFNDNGDQPYCSFVIRPKVEKFKKVFSHKLKQSGK